MESEPDKQRLIKLIFISNLFNYYQPNKIILIMSELVCKVNKAGYVVYYSTNKKTKPVIKKNKKRERV